MAGTEPDRQTRQAAAATATAFVDGFVSGLEDAPVPTRLLAPSPDGPGDLADLLARFGDAASRAIETAGPRDVAHVPAGGPHSCVLAEFLARTVNRHTGVAGPAHGLAATERLPSRVNRGRRVHLSSTRPHSIRLCVPSVRTHRSQVDEALAIIHHAAGDE
ncbi:hypothetical protein [Actinophytocola sp.]|uniref:hypothetical protein n=1 Tax=Actinophytocola sp. TaxID=1872138 RepID=UPI00389A2E6C